MNLTGTRQRGAAGAWILAIIVVLALAFVAWRWLMYSSQSSAPDVEPATTSTLPAAASTAERYPISAIDTRSPAPATSVLLGEPDSTTVMESLGALPGGQALSTLLNQPEVIQRIVATVDALPGKRLSAKVLPVKLPGGSFQVAENQGSTVISEDNAARYAPYLEAAEQLDTPTLVQWYVSHYPMFEQAYRQLGYPQGHFNDRLVVVINNLLAAPELKSTPLLVRYKNGWAYADKNLESLSAGQKMLLRLGPAEQSQVRSRLRELRAALTGTEFPGPSATSD